MPYDNNMRGVLFKNTRKTQPNQPDYTGTCEIEGDEFRLSAWIKDGKQGKFMSIAFKPKENDGPHARSQDDDDIPF